MEKIRKEIDRNRTALLLKTGILGAAVILAGDLLMGWGVRDAQLTGLAGQLSPYLAVSDSRMFWASVLGFTGVPLAVAGHFGIYRLIKPCSRSCARMYAAGNLGFLAFGGAGVHVSSVEAAFFYKYMTAADAGTALASTVKFASCFLLPLYIVVLACWAVMVYAQIRAIAGKHSPYPRWCWVFSMLVGSLFVSPLGLLGNYAPVNALMVGAFSLGNVWTLAGHLWMLRRSEKDGKLSE